MRIDLHCHSKYSHDNYLEPEILIRQAIKLGLDGVCFTEHYSVTASRPVEKISVPEGFYVFRGVEIATDHGHLLAYGVKDDAWNLWGRDNYLPFQEVTESVHKLGGICVPAHPFRGWEAAGDRILEMNGIDAIETHNGKDPETAHQQAIRVARMRSLPSVGGSDCHRRVEVGRAFTLFDNPIRTIEELAEAIREGNCKGVCECPCRC
ncbi:MAG: metal-dependent phosphohydrolase [Desulfobacteraceae bacterium 4572_88]|nr:MAG: metal-dependent phosphohydrolase [Desulfobacteraceae bacterium 4572_88]RLC18259.1 MAG: metal-dependent phosphohydrolase [Deltaproteobacteria bacterium]